KIQGLSSTKRDIVVSSVSSAFEISGTDFGACQKLRAGARHGDATVHHDIGAMGELERMEGVLLDQEHGQALAGIELADDLEDLLHDQGSEAERWLIEQQQAGPRHQGAGDRQHLLLAARE